MIVDLNPKEPLEHSSKSYQRVPTLCGCACERAPAPSAPTDTVSCRDKSAALSVPSHQKYTRFWPKPGSPQPWGLEEAGVGGGLQGGVLYLLDKGGQLW